MSIVKQTFGELENTEWFLVDWVPPFFEPEAFGLFGGIVDSCRGLSALVVGWFSKVSRNRDFALSSKNLFLSLEARNLGVMWG